MLWTVLFKLYYDFGLTTNNIICVLMCFSCYNGKIWGYLEITAVAGRWLALLSGLSFFSSEWHGEAGSEKEVCKKERRYSFSHLSASESLQSITFRLQASGDLIVHKQLTAY